MNPLSIINFWFHELIPEQWWKKDPVLDQHICENYRHLHQQAQKGELWEWRSTPEGRLAEILILDQFSRHIYRGQLQAFSNDSMALVLAQEAILLKANLGLAPVKRSFLYLPFMHSESSRIHEIAVKLYTDLGLEENLKFELLHKRIIDQFGRYPHRNEILKRTSTEEELAFLQQENSQF
ncbi:membrane protein [Candidatus Paracaedimonas acanthamoebae]|nr:membrane protein [Candidatus Paracaedimonas acanthamoebae]